MADTRDLSILTGGTIDVKLTPDGQTYKLPADVPIPLVLRSQQCGRVLQDEAASDEQKGEALEQLYDQVLALFQQHQPEMAEVPLNSTQLIAFYAVVYGGADLSQPQEAEQAPPTPRSGRPKGQRKK